MPCNLDTSVPLNNRRFSGSHPFSCQRRCGFKSRRQRSNTRNDPDGVQPSRSALLGCCFLPARCPTLQNAPRAFELRTARGAQALPTSIDEVLNHPDTRPEPAWRHVSACHRPRDFRRRTAERAAWGMGGVGRHRPDPFPFRPSAFRCLLCHHACRNRTVIGMWRFVSQRKAGSSFALSRLRNWSATGGVTMRKQDRIANQQQSRSQPPPEKQSQPEPREREQVKGNASQNQAERPQRQPGRLPLPD